MAKQKAKGLQKVTLTLTTDQVAYLEAQSARRGGIQKSEVLRRLIDHYRDLVEGMENGHDGGGSARGIRGAAGAGA